MTGRDIELVGQPDGEIPALKQRALFVALSLNPNEALHRDYLADLLWPDTSQDAARQNLRMTLLNLRRALPAEWSAWIDAKPQTICLDVDKCAIDVFLIEDAAKDSTLEGCERVEALYHGDLLAHFPEVSPEFDRLISERRTSLRHLFHSAMIRLLENAAEAGDQIRVQGFYDRLHATVPESEQAIVTAMAFWAGQGATDRLDDAFEDFRQGYLDAFDAPLPEHLETVFKGLREKSVKTSGPQVHAHAEPSLHLAFPEVTASSRENRRVITSPLVFSLGGLLLLFAFLFFWIDRSDGRTFALSAPDVTLDDCGIESVEARYRDMVVQALLDAVPGLQLVRSDNDAISDFPAPDLEVLQTIYCAQNDFRGTTTIVDNASQTIAWSAQHNGLGVAIDFSVLSE